MGRIKDVVYGAKEDMIVDYSNERQMSLASCWLKRSLDVLGSVVGLVIFSPVFIFIGVFIKREDNGPIFFRQERIGYHGRSFTLYKFRSMISTAESDGNPKLCQKQDKRLTHIGRFLREHHLDELPQLWNVLKGDMGFVGPRPERRFFIDKIISINPSYKLLYQLRPGLFSTATLYNGYTDTMEKMLERLRMDLEYLHNRSLWMDIKIIYQTALAIVSCKKF